MRTSQRLAKVEKKSGSKGSEGVCRYVYDSPGLRSSAEAGGSSMPAREAWSLLAPPYEDCGVSRGKSPVAEEERRPLPPRLARLNMWGMRARESEGAEPSVGCMDWYCSNSRRRALRARR